MCLILTCIAAIVVTVLSFLFPKLVTHFQLDRLARMYWSAALMWMVDGIFRIREGEAFFEFSVNDTLLGVLIVFCGVLFWCLLTLARNRKMA